MYMSCCLMLSHAVSPQDFTNSSGGAVGAGVCTPQGSSGSSGRRSCNQAKIAASVTRSTVTLTKHTGSRMSSTELQAHGALKITQM